MQPKDLIVNILLPLSIFLVVVALVFDFLLVSVEAPGTTAEQVSNTPKEMVRYDGSELTLSWQAHYQGGMAIDGQVGRSGDSLRITTSPEEGWYGARAELPASMEEVGVVSFAVRVEDWQAVERVMLLFFTKDGGDEYFGLNLTNYFAQPESEQWQTVALDRSAFAVIQGQPDWAGVDEIVVRVVPKDGVITRVWLDDLRLYERMPERQAIVSMTFDDGFDAVEEAQAIMDLHQFRGTAYIIPELLGTEGYLTQDQVDMLAATGWDIGGHGARNLVMLSPAEARADLTAMREYLAVREYQGRQHYAYPNGGYNPAVQSLVLESFESARTIDGFHQPPEVILPAAVNAITISSSTPVTEVVAEIDRAIRQGTWLNLVWHDFSTDPALSYEYHIEDFAWIVEYLSDRGVLVLPYSEAYAILTQALK